MKKIINFVKTNSLTILGALAMIVGLSSASAATFWGTNQPECPRELLK
jgi:cyclic lactone autoinducer peptide